MFLVFLFNFCFHFVNDFEFFFLISLVLLKISFLQMINSVDLQCSDFMLPINSSTIVVFATNLPDFHSKHTLHLIRILFVWVETIPQLYPRRASIPQFCLSYRDFSDVLSSELLPTHFLNNVHNNTSQWQCSNRIIL